MPGSKFCWIALLPDMRKFLLASASLPLFLSCSTPRYSYAPARVNAPLLEEKNEVQANGSISVLKGFDASAAYALTSHLGLMLNGSWRNDDQEGHVSSVELLPPREIKYHRTSVELGIGWFSRINSSKWHFEIFAGMGKGKFSIKDVGILDINVPYSRDYDSKLTRIFIQPAFGINSSSKLQLVFFTRFQFQRYHGLQTNYSSSEMEHYLIPQNSSKYYGFAEPGFSIRAYFTSMPAIGFETNFLLSYRFDSGSMNYIPIHMSAGVHIRFQNSRPK